MRVRYSYLHQQFAESEPYLDDIRGLVESGDFTLGAAVDQFEERFAEVCDLPYAVGVGSGTDALILSMRMAGIGHGDEVITTPNTFTATVGAIVATGAKPVFVDNDEHYTINPELISAAITSRTKGILPVHLTGHPADMPRIMEIANKNNLVVIEDAAQSILASIDGKHVGHWGETAAFSLHPLKNLNVWGDGGIIATRSKEMYDKLKLYRNHGLETRDNITVFGVNSRLDSLQALVANRLIDQVHEITDSRIANAHRYDKGFSRLGEWVVIPPRSPNVKQVYHTYVIQVADRDSLVDHLKQLGVDAKVHYPTPLHLQPAADYLGYKSGDFPLCEEHCKTIISLPVHQHITEDEIDFVIDSITKFYEG